MEKSVGPIVLKIENVCMSQRGEECPTYSRGKEGQLDWSHVAYELLKHVIEGKIEGRTDVAGRRGRRKKLLDDL